MKPEWMQTLEGSLVGLRSLERGGQHFCQGPVGVPVRSPAQHSGSWGWFPLVRLSWGPHEDQPWQTHHHLLVWPGEADRCSDYHRWKGRLGSPCEWSPLSRLEVSTLFGKAGRNHYFVGFVFGF